jgi:hypothetical protein
MLKSVKKKTIQPDMTKIPFHGYTIEDGSSTIFTFGPFGSWRIATAKFRG